MRILILGAGALGGYFGGRLLAAGRDVTFLVRPRTAEQLAEHGLRIERSFRGDLSLAHPPTLLDGQIDRPFDLILLSCKAYDLESSMESIAPAVGDGTLILPMLNGMAHMDALDARFGPEHVLGGTCFISAARTADGTILHLNHRDELLFGHRTDPADPRLQQIAATLAGAHFGDRLHPHILQAMWEKWSFLATLACLTCLMRAAIGDIVAVDPTLPGRMFDESIAIATAQGFAPDPQFAETQRSLMTAPGSLFTASMLRDLEEGGRIERQQIVGDLLERGRRKGLSAPLLELAHTHLAAYEKRRERESAQK